MKRVGGGKKHCLAKKKLISRRQRSNQTSTFISNWHHFLSVVNLIVRHIALCFFHEFRRLVWAVGSYSAVQPAGRIWYRKKHITKHSAPLDARRCTKGVDQPSSAANLSYLRGSCRRRGRRWASCLRRRAPRRTSPSTATIWKMDDVRLVLIRFGPSFSNEKMSIFQLCRYRGERQVSDWVGLT